MISGDSTFPLYPICTCICFILCLIPLPWHIQAWNSGTCAFMLWTALACLAYFVDSLVWAGNVSNPAPIWCDIVSKILVGVAVGIPAATLCISRRLYTLTHIQTASLTRHDKRRMVYADLTLALGFPVFIMCIHYIVQPHRFDIYEDVGCYPAIYNTLPTYFLYLMWPVVFGLISFFYSSMTIRSFWIRRAQFTQLVSCNSSMSASRYFRLVILALVDMMFTVPLGLVTIIHGIKSGVAPWISWEDTHYNFSRVGLYPALIWRNSPLLHFGIEFTRWLPVFCAILFFALFGFASEARKSYTTAFQVLIKPAYSLKGKEKMKEKTSTDSSNFSHLKPLKLVNQANNSIVNGPLISTPVFISSSNPSLNTLITPSPPKYDDRVSHFSPVEHETIVDSDSVSRFSLYAQPYDVLHSPCSSTQYSSSAANPSNQPPQLPEIPLSPPLSASLSTLPTPIPESVGPTFYRSPSQPGCLPSPPYHRPFCGPSIYPTTRPHPSTQQEILVTVHRQASVDEIV